MVDGDEQKRALRAFHSLQRRTIGTSKNTEEEVMRKNGTEQPRKGKKSNKSVFH